VILLSRLIAALAYAGAAFLFGVALGERGELGIVQQLFAYVIPFVTLVLAFVTKPGARANVLLTGTAMCAGVLLGQFQFRRAWDDCLTRGYVVRDTLVRYHAQHDAYPARLEELGIEIPCRCGFRKTILRYLSNERGFRLWVTNDRRVVAFSEFIPREDAGSRVTPR
jgi:hypothetical protein